MAQSRIGKAASIFTRCDGLVKSKLIEWKDRPMWYDIYKAFPPARDPAYRSILGAEKAAALPPKIFYKEDNLRAYYFENLTPIGTVVLNSNKKKPIYEIFISEYKNLAKSGISHENLVKATVEELNNKGYYIRIKKKGESDPDDGDEIVETRMSAQSLLNETIEGALANINTNVNKIDPVSQPDTNTSDSSTIKVDENKNN